jgi:PIN domain nuclease of toxin-antitoxin system
VSLLLDTHTFLWFVLNDPALSHTVRHLIGDQLNQVVISPATYWELAIKIKLGRLQVPGVFEDFVTEEITKNGFVVLPITVPHAAAVATLPLHHRDPFDRMLIAQAIVERMPILSADPALDAYPVTRLW